nr:MAG TPA: hypothetical protein [Caudoviricetes sp.]
MSFRWALTAAGIEKPSRAVTRGGGVQEFPSPPPHRAGREFNSKTRCLCTPARRL